MPLDPNYPKEVLINTIIWQIIITIAFTVAYFMLNLPTPLWLIVLIEVTFSIIWSYQSAKACRFALREQDIIYQRGIWSQSTTAVSFNRIQHIDISHGPIERKFNIATIKLFTAGGSGADLTIAGLPQTTAEQIRQQILTKINAEELTESQSEQHHE